MRPIAIAASAAALVMLASVGRAGARPLFEPTDLELETPGVVDLDFQLGAVLGRPSRAPLPDFEIDVGLAPNVELGIDGSFGRTGEDLVLRNLSTSAFDPLWLSAKLGLYDRRDPASGRAWALGAQLGPRFAVARDARSVGYEALALVGRSLPPLHLVLNAGGRFEPTTAGAPSRSTALEIGLDAAIDLDADGRAKLLGEIGWLRFLTPDPHQVYVTLGASYAVGRLLDVSAIALVGFMPSGDRFGVLLGVSPKMELF